MVTMIKQQSVRKYLQNVSIFAHINPATLMVPLLPGWACLPYLETHAYEYIFNVETLVAHRNLGRILGTCDLLRHGIIAIREEQDSGEKIIYCYIFIHRPRITLYLDILLSL
jgi:hypothetical protein